MNAASKPPVRQDRRLRRNSVPLFVHGLVEYGVGALTIVAPFLFSFDSDIATVVSILLGAGIIVMGFVTEARPASRATLPIASHVVLDYVASLLMIVAPFIFGFTDDTAATAYFILIGVGYLLLTVATRYRAGLSETEADRVARGLEAQLEALAQKRAEGAELIGWKVGLNAPPVQEHLGLDATRWSATSRPRSLLEPGLDPLARAAAKRVGVEPEVAIHVGAGGTIESLGPAIEIVDLDPALDGLEAILAGKRLSPRRRAGRPPWRALEPARPGGADGDGHAERRGRGARTLRRHRRGPRRGRRAGRRAAGARRRGAARGRR